MDLAVSLPHGPCGRQPCYWRSHTHICVVHRAITYYLADRRYDMLPSILSADLCSLLGGVDRWVCSWFFFFDHQGLSWLFCAVQCFASGLFLLCFWIHSAPLFSTPIFPLSPLRHSFVGGFSLDFPALPVVFSVRLAVRPLLPLLLAF